MISGSVYHPQNEIKFSTTDLPAQYLASDFHILIHVVHALSVWRTSASNVVTHRGAAACPCGVACSESVAEHSGLLGNLQLLPQTAHLIIESNHILRRDRRPVRCRDGDLTSPVGVEGKRTSRKCDGVFAHNASLHRGRNIVVLAEFCEFIGQTRFHRDALSTPLLAP